MYYNLTSVSNSSFISSTETCNRRVDLADLPTLSYCKINIKIINVPSISYLK